MIATHTETGENLHIQIGYLGLIWAHSAYLHNQKYFKDEARGGVYRHAKNGELYRMIIHAFSDDIKSLCIYQDTKGNVWARPSEMFFNSIEHDGETVQRFQLAEVREWLHQTSI